MKSARPRRGPPRFAPLAERVAWGRGRRHACPRKGQGDWTAPANRPDPVDLLRRATADRIPELVPIRFGRMLASPFGFLRGAAPLWAADVSRLPASGIAVQISGDAHVRNLGAYAAPDGHLVFDVNDFDETVVAPWEWDLKRLAASVVLAGREAGDREARCVEAVRTLVRSYREALGRFAQMPVLELARHEIRRAPAGPVASILRKAERATPLVNLGKLTVPAGGSRRFASRPPLLTRVPERTAARVLGALAAYRATLTPARQPILDAYRPADVAFKVVGTGSVGVRDYAILLFSNGPGDPLFLQMKEETASAYARVLKGSRPGHEGRRVAEGQHRLQSEVDPFVGWTTLGGRDFLVRQLADHKAGVTTGELRGEALSQYAAVAGEIFAKAHARTCDPAVLWGYCGPSDRLDRALARFATAYADQTTTDHERLVAAVRKGLVRARPGV